MKTPALLTLLLAALLAALPARHARAQDASFDLFYNSLADDGDWYNTPDFGYVWHPAIADGNNHWRPYTDGYWAQTDDGWAWVSYESFGWATYHYGRWTRLQSIGWAWVPGYQWGPGWVSWRTNDDYVGWAPLPPRAERTGQAVSVDYNDVEAVDDGYTAAVDQDYDIGPENYCFVGVRQFGAPVLAQVILPPAGNLIILQNTINVTNIYYRRGPDRTVVYNTGPDFGFISAHVERPIQRLRIDQHTDLGYLRANGHGGNPTVVRDGVLQVAAPMIARRPVNFEQVRPPRVKQTIAHPQIVNGWSNAGGNAAQVQQAHERIRTQAQAAPRQARADLPPQGGAPTAPEARERAPFNPPGQGPADADRAGRRDAVQHDRDARDQTRPGGENAPARTVAAPSNEGVAPGTVKPPASQERAERQRTQAPTPATQAPTPNGRDGQRRESRPAATPPSPNPPRPEADTRDEQRREIHSATPPSNQPRPEARDEQRRDARPATPQANQPRPEADAREEHRENRAAAQGQPNPSRPQAEQGPREAQRPEHVQPSQPAQGQAAPERATHREEREAQPAQGKGNAQPGKDDDKKKHDNN